MNNTHEINNLFFIADDLIAQDDTTRIICDPAPATSVKLLSPNNKNRHFIFEVVILTHLSETNLHLLYNLPKNLTCYLSQELFLLLQKMQRFNLIPALPTMGKIIPYDYPQQLGSFSITAYKNNDSLFGSLALILRHKQTAVGYVAAFELYGGHKKRTKNWLKQMSRSKLTAFITSHTMLENNYSAQLPTSENGIQKYFAKQLQKAAEQPVKVLLSPWNPEQLHRFNETCADLNKKLVLPLTLAQFLHSFFPEDIIYYSSNVQQATKPLVTEQLIYLSLEKIQKEPATIVLYDSSMPFFIDPSIQKNSTGYNYFKPTIAPLAPEDITMLKQRLNITTILLTN
ncbi:hypothetical protein [Liquorilactobacillus capillatus]|uniref:Uncharacterized protein n=1 Tax=Liquorilactobacillus capillatus DSM 19910 TaxID=1423731 RepID=A0A0R1LWS5_9LACO|nr:hypothetical protein [Liquorilactobacillus capillatus]KRL00079.1 hypothetical protein FC81_GL000456 [Liquorilactobacillus capillatus DSM 19910]